MEKMRISVKELEEMAHEEDKEILKQRIAELEKEVEYLKENKSFENELWFQKCKELEEALAQYADDKNWNIPSCHDEWHWVGPGIGPELAKKTLKEDPLIGNTYRHLVVDAENEGDEDSEPPGHRPVERDSPDRELHSGDGSIGT